MSWQPDRVVAIAKGVADGYELIGSGAVVADRRVLTAAHVVSAHVVVDERTGTTTPPLFARRDGASGFLPLGALLWRGADKLDAALFAWDHAHVSKAQQAHPGELFSAHDLFEGRSWYARGYPILDPRNLNARLARFGGTTARFFGGHDPEIELPVTVRPDDYRGYGGLSGAAVMDEHDRVVGVVKAVVDPAVWRGDKLTAVPAARLVRCPEFLEALGVTADAARLQWRLDAVIADIERLIGPRATLAEALARELALDPAGGVSALVGRVVREVPAVKLARVLNRLHDATRDPHERRVLESLFWKALRYAGDWRDEIERNLARFEDPSSAEPVRLALRCWSKSVATVVLAGLDDTDVAFLSEQSLQSAARPDLRGAGFVNVPATELAPIFSRQGATATRAIVQNLAREYADPSFSDLIDSVDPDEYSELCERVANVLHVSTHEPMRPGERAPRYLVVNRRDVKTHGRDAFELLAKEVHRVLPSLRIVLLEGLGLPDSKAEEHLYQAIVSMVRNRTP